MVKSINVNDFFYCLKASIFLILLIAQSNLIYSQSNNTGCNFGSHEIVRPFLGEWKEYTITDTSEVYIGRLSTHLNVEGCVLTQSFVTPDSSFSYLSHGFINPLSGVWEETYVFNSGRYSKFLWIVDGESLYTLRVEGSRKTNHHHRLKYTDIKKDEYSVIQQESVDGGKTWISKDSTRIKRIK